MRTRRSTSICNVLTGIAASVLWGGAVRGDEAAGQSSGLLSLAAADSVAPTDDSGKPAAQSTSLALSEPDEGSGLPFSFDITYYLYSDYIFRGANFSEYRGEGRERLNHQMTTNLSFDVAKLVHGDEGSLGNFAFGTAFEWFEAQRKLNPDGGGQNAQEIDYLLSWSYELEPIDTTLTLGYSFFTYPNAKAINTSEWSVKLEHNDAWMWKWLLPDNEDGVLNPSFLFVRDVDFVNGSWMEFGFSHDFAVVDKVTVTPSVILAIDHRYLDPALGTGGEGSTRFAYIQYGLTASYDLTDLIRLTDWGFGSFVWSGFLYFNDAVGIPEDDLIQDEFFGGTSFTWSF